MAIFQSLSQWEITLLQKNLWFDSELREVKDGINFVWVPWILWDISTQIQIFLMELSRKFEIFSQDVDFFSIFNPLSLYQDSSKVKVF